MSRAKQNADRDRSGQRQALRAVTSDPGHSVWTMAAKDGTSFLGSLVTVESPSFHVLKIIKVIMCSLEKNLKTKI